jgi:hypothetical protein
LRTTCFLLLSVPPDQSSTQDGYSSCEKTGHSTAARRVANEEVTYQETSQKVPLKRAINQDTIYPRASSKNPLKTPTPEPTTPKTPKKPTNAKLLGTKNATATAVRNHATASNTSLHKMLEWLMDMVMETQPRSVDERKGLLDALAEQLVDIDLFSLYYQDPKLLERKSFSTLTKSEWDRVCEEIQLNYKGAIHFSSTKKLLDGIPALPQSLLEQLEIAKSVNVSDVCDSFFVVLMSRTNPDAV